MRRPLAALLATVLPACSLLGIDQYELPPPCTSDADCDALNDYQRIDPTTARELWQCRERTGECIRRLRDDDDDGHASVAAGGDDCDDGDPNAFPGAPVVLTPIVSGVAAPAWLRWGSDLSGGVAVSYAHQMGGAFDLLPADASSVGPTTVGFATDADLDDLVDAAIQLSCPRSAFEAPRAPPTGTPVGTTPGVTCESHAECDDGVLCNGYEECAPMRTGADDRGCVQGGDPCLGLACDEAAERCVRVAAVASGCAIGDLATGHARADEHLAVLVNGSGCPHGQARLAWLSTGALDSMRGLPGANLLMRGDQRRAPAFYGVDLVSEPGRPLCTGGGRPDGAPVGVASPSIAPLSGDPGAARYRPQALVGWLAAPSCRARPGGCARAGTAGSCETTADCPEGFTCTRSTCGGGPLTDTNGDGVADYGDDEPVVVELLGAWLEEAPTSGGAYPITWVTASGSGVPERLPTRAAGVGPPATAAVAAPAGYVVAYGAEGGGIAVRFVPALGDPPGVVASAPYPTPIAPLGGARSTPPIPDLGDEQILAGGGGVSAVVDHVVVATGAPSGDAAPLLMAWLEGSEVWTARLTLAASGAISAAAPVRLTSSATSPPGVAAGCGAGCEGWSVAWAEDDGVRLVRLGPDGVALDEAPADLGGSPSGRPQPVTASGSARVAFHDEALSAIVMSNSQCGAP